MFSGIGAVLYACIFLMRYLDKECWKSVSPSERILDFVTLFILLMHLVFWDFGDEYLLSLLPFTLIVVGTYLRNCILRHWKIPLVASLVLLIISAIWIRASHERAEAYWKGGELLRKRSG